MSRRRKPRSGPKPSPWRRTASTAAPQSTRTPRRRGSSCQVREPTRKVTATSASALERRSRTARARPGVIPPTSTPATRTPSASRLGEPAKASPNMVAASPAMTAAIPVRWRTTRRWARVFRRRLGRTSLGLARAGKASKSSRGFGASRASLSRSPMSLQRTRNSPGSRIHSGAPRKAPGTVDHCCQLVQHAAHLPH